MTLRRFVLSLFLPLVFAGGLLPGDALAQAPRINTDSLRLARQASIDSARTARQAVLDSAKTARESAARIRLAAQKQRTDSLARVKKYRESRRYTDSVARVRLARTDSSRAITRVRLDSLKTVRQRTTDSMTEARSAVTAARQAEQKRRIESLAAVQKYKSSKRYADSVAVVRKTRADSIAVVRRTSIDSATSSRKAAAQVITDARKRSLDSATSIRTAFADSIKGVRKLRTDSAAAKKVARDKAAKEKAKEREVKFNLALELKIKKKRQAWSNEKMLSKKWSLPRQALQNTFTRYNYYFNTDRKMEEALDNMQRMKKESYDSVIALFPFDPDRDSAALKPDMDSIIQKASIGIQIHDPRTKWGDDLYLLMGQAYYYKGDYENASASFRYIIALRELDKKRREKERQQSLKTPKASRTGPSILEEDKDGPLDFLKHESVHNEALLWLARTYTESGRTGEAESVLDLLISDPKFPESLKGRYALEKAYLTLAGRTPRSAGRDLVTVAEDGTMPAWLRLRSAYLAGQLAYQSGSYQQAADRFRAVLGLNPGVEMDFYARKYLAYSMMESGGDGREAIASLRGILKDGKYAPYHEQVYFVLGRLSANSGQNEEAIGYLQKSIAAPRATRRVKAQSFAALGDAYYATGVYERSKLAYDSAAILGGRNSADPVIQLAARRAKTLDELVGPARTIRKSDSLLALAALSEKEQRAVVRRYIRGLQAARDDSAFRAENPLTGAMASNTLNAGPAGNEPGDDWYFANATLMQQGAADFKKKWGNRPLADNWRRASSASGGFAGVRAGTVDPGEPEQVEGFGTDGLPTEESLLAAIPNSSGQQEATRARLRRAYVDMGTAYIQNLEDYPRATSTLDTLDRRFKNHEHGAETVYLRYLTALRQNNISGAQVFADALLRDYSTSSWAALVRPADAGDVTAGAVASAEAGQFYEETYSMMQARQYGEVLSRSREGRRRWADKRFADRFLIIEGTALAGTGAWNAADTLLRDFLSAAPPDSLRVWAEAVRSYIQRNKPVDSATSGATASTANAAAEAPSSAPGPAPALLGTPPGETAGAPPAPGAFPTPAAALPTGLIEPVATPADAPAAFVYAPQSEHYFILAVPKMEQRAMGTKAGIADFNTFKFGRQKLTTGIDMLSAQQGLVIVRAFPTSAAAKIYANAFRAEAALMRDYKTGETTPFIISSANYKKLIADRAIAAYLQWYGKNYK